MKFITLVIFTILALCAAFSEARPLRPMREMRLRGISKRDTDLTLIKYRDKNCENEFLREDLDKKCFSPKFGFSEEYGDVIEGEVTVKYCQGGCRSPSAICDEVVFKKGDCKKDPITNNYVSLTWDD